MKNATISGAIMLLLTALMVGSLTERLVLNGYQGSVVASDYISVFYDGVTNTTGVCYQGPNQYPWLLTYDNKNSRFTEHQIASYNPLDADDGHGAPICSLDNQGYVHAFYGSHGTQVQYHRTTTPRSFDSWTNLTSNFNQLGSYISSFQFNDTDTVVIQRGTGGNWTTKYTKDNGVTWSSEKVIFDTKYCGSGACDLAYLYCSKSYDVIMCPLYIYNGVSAITYRDIGYMELRQDGKWYKSTGVEYTSPPNNDTFEKIYTTGYQCGLTSNSIKTPDGSQKMFLAMCRDRSSNGAWNSSSMFVNQSGAWNMFNITRSLSTPKNIDYVNSSYLRIFVVEGGTNKLSVYYSLNNGSTWAFDGYYLNYNNSDIVVDSMGLQKYNNTNPIKAAWATKDGSIRLYQRSFGYDNLIQRTTQTNIAIVGKLSLIGGVVMI